MGWTADVRRLLAACGGGVAATIGTALGDVGAIEAP